MEEKRRLKIAYRLTELYDFITEDMTLEEVIEDIDFLISQEELDEVIEYHNEWGMDYVTEKIIDNYFDNE